MQVKLKNPLDMHVHLRQDEMLDSVAPLTARLFSGALVMPNLLPPIKTREDIINYKIKIKDAIGDYAFESFMSVFFTENLNYDVLEEMKDDILVVKLYPGGVTTNSDGGVETIDLDKLGHIFQAMEKLGIPLSIHGETNGFVLDREAEFASVYELLAKTYPRLKIIMEHMTTLDLVELLNKYDNLYATITAHHLLITVDDILGGMISPHMFCKPIAKTYKDREKLLELALNAHPKVMFGSDSAPHPREKKECANGAAGIFTAPITLQLLAQIFEQNGKLQNLQAFISDNAQKIYNIKPLEKEIVLEKKDFVVPDMYGNIVPFWAGKTIGWSVVS